MDDVVVTTVNSKANFGSCSDSQDGGSSVIYSAMVRGKKNIDIIQSARTRMYQDLLAFSTWR
jgi:hypothetical protein